MLPEQERKVRALFKAVDTDGSGSVTPEELRGAMATFGLDPHDPSYASILEQADEDGTYTLIIQFFFNCLLVFWCWCWLI